MTKYILLLGIILTVLPVAIASTHTDALDRVEFKSYHRLKIKTETLEYRVNYSSTNPDIAKEEIENQILISTNKILKGVKNKKSCKYLILNMYDIPYSYLNNRSKMTFIESDYLVDGLYDSKYSDPGYAAIFITIDVDMKTRDDTLNHEIAHYINEIMCVDIDTEDFAISSHD